MGHRKRYNNIQHIEHIQSIYQLTGVSFTLVRGYLVVSISTKVCQYIYPCLDVKLWQHKPVIEPTDSTNR